MKRVVISFLAALLFASAGCTTTTGVSIAASDAEIQRLETSKWNPSTLGSREAFMALFADDFVSVEYGSDVQGGVHRKTRADVFSAPPLPPAQFELSDWRFVHADPHVFIVSYHVDGISFPWQAYATSVWVQRDGRWQTVFYQASTAQ
ncbi:MAG TPA: nuclear transport factor 2 family protein [Thermoanaerobaculia bacterium]